MWAMARLPLAANGGFTYTPTAGYTGPDSFTYKANDGTADSNTVTVSLTVTAPGSSLAGQWLANEGSGSTLVDSSGSGNSGALQGNPTWVAGQHGQAIRFDGTGDYAVVPDASSLDLSSAITIAAWVRPEKLATQYLVKKATNGGTNGYELALSSAGKVFVRFNQVTSADTFRINSTTYYPINSTTWMHVAATYDGTTMQAVHQRCRRKGRSPARPRSPRTTSGSGSALSLMVSRSCRAHSTTSTSTTGRSRRREIEALASTSTGNGAPTAPTVNAPANGATGIGRHRP